MADTTRPFHWGRPNPNYAGPSRAAAVDSDQLSFDDVMSDFVSESDQDDDQVTFGRDDAHEVLVGFVSDWLETTGHSDAAGVLIGPAGSPSDATPVTMDEFRRSPQSHLPPPSAYTSTRVGVSGDDHGITVDYGPKTRGTWTVDVVEDRSDFEAILDDKATRAAEATAAVTARTEANVARFRELASGGPKDFLVVDRTVSPRRGSERIYRLDTEKVERLQMDTDAVHDYVSVYLGDHLFGATYDPDTGVYSGFTD